MLRRSHLRLIGVTSLFIIACQLLSSVSPTPSGQNGLATPENTTPSTDSSTNSKLPAPDLPEDQQIAFSSNVSGIFLSLPFLNEINQGLYPEIQKELAGLYLTVNQIFPVNFRETIESSKDDPSKPDRLASYQTFFDQVDGLSQQEKTDLINETIDEFSLNSNMPNRLQFEYTTMTLAFDPGTYQSNIRIRVLEPSDLSLTSDAIDRITVMGSLLDPHTFENLPYGPLELAGEPTLEEHDVSGLPPQYFLNIPVRGAMDWGLVHVDKGAIKSDSQGDEVGYFLIVKGPYGLHHLMAMRPLPPDTQGMSFLTPQTYGAPEPKQLPIVPQDQLESVMRQNLEHALQKAVTFGDIRQGEADDLLAKFDDSQIINAIPDPTMRAALLLSTTFKSVGGDLILPVVLGQNSHQSPVGLFFDGDPQLDVLYQGRARPELGPNEGIVWEFDDGTILFIAGKNWGNGQEPIEYIASLLPHEVLIHESKKDSMTEETMGCLVQAVAWANLIRRDPDLIMKGTYGTQYSNLLLFPLLNSVFVDEQAKSPLTSHVGLTSRITGVQTHDQANLNILPGNNVQSVSSFYNLIKLFDTTAVRIDPTSPGSEVTLQLFRSLFGADAEFPSQFDLNHDQIPDFSELFLVDYLDKHVQDVMSDQTFKDLAQVLHMTLDGRNTTP